MSFTVKEGEFLTLLGPSGCGKSTTLNLIAGMLMPSKGEISINGKLMNDIPCNKRNIGLVFQNYALFPHMSVFENVAFGLRMKKFPSKTISSKVQESLRLVNMLGYEDRKPAELSGGQQQRIALARALAFDPDVLLLDEPLSNLDAKLRESVGIELKQLHEKTKKTIIYVTHDQIEALTMSDRIILMNKGSIEQEGTPSELYTSPKGLFAADFIGANSFVNCIVDEICDDFVIVGFGDNSRVKARTVPSQTFEVGQKATLAIRPENVELVKDSQEDKFMNLLDGKIYNYQFRGANVLLYLDIAGSILKVETTVENAALINEKKDKIITVGFNDCIIFDNLISE